MVVVVVFVQQFILLLELMVLHQRIIKIHPPVMILPANILMVTKPMMAPLEAMELITINLIIPEPIALEIVVMMEIIMTIMIIITIIRINDIVLTPPLTTIHIHMISFKPSLSRSRTTKQILIQFLTFSIYHMPRLVLFVPSNNSTKPSPPDISNIKKYPADIVKHKKFFHRIQLA